MTTGHLKAPLAGVRVLDFTNLPPGAACSAMLANLGALVTRVEPPAQKGSASGVFGQVALSHSKRSLTLNMRDPRAADTLARLVREAEIVLENAAPGTMEQRGFGYSHARATNEAIIWCSLTGFGQDGPYAHHAGHDLNFLAHSGLLAALSEDRDWHPGVALALQAGALSAVVAIQAALIRRGASGEGALIDVSLSEAALWFLTCGMNPLSERPFSIPVTPDRRTYACSDGRLIAIACAEPRTWSALCDELKLPELIPQLHKWDDAAAVQLTLARTFAREPAAVWAGRLSAKGAAACVVNHASEVLQDPHMQARSAVVEVGGVPVPRAPFRISGLAPTMTPPRLVGADTTMVLTEAGYSADEIEEFERTGLV